MVAEVMQESGTAFGLRARSDRGDGWPGKLHRRAHRHRRRARFGARDSRRTVRHRQPLGDGAQRARGRRSRRGAFAVAVDARRGMLYLGLYDEAGAQDRRATADRAGRGRACFRQGFASPREAARSCLPQPARGRDAASPRRCRSFSRARQRWPKSPPRAARPRRRSDLFICGRRMQDRRRKRSRGADAGRDRGHTRELARRCVDGGHSPKLLRQGLGRDGDDAIPRKPRSAVSDRLGGRQLRRHAGRSSHRAEGGRRSGDPHARAWRPLAGTPVSAARCWLRPWRNCARPAPSDCSSKSRTATTPRSGSIARSARCRSADATGYYDNGADAAIFSLALSTGPEDDGTALARRPA